MAESLKPLAHWPIWEQGRLFYMTVSVDATGTIFVRIELPHSRLLL